MSKYLVKREIDGLVVNVIVWDAVSPYLPPDGHGLVPCEDWPGVWIGWRYDADADVFIAPQPFPSWTLDANHDWQPPTPKPTEGGPWSWDEPTLSWVEVTA